MGKRGIFFKVFTYTIIFLFIMVSVTVGLFSQQFLLFYNTNQAQQIYTSYSNLHNQLLERSEEEIIRIAGEFFSFNPSFDFYIRANDGQIIFSTPNADFDDGSDISGHRIRMSIGEHTLFAVNRTASQADYSSLLQRSLLAVAGLMSIGVLGAFIFAKQMTSPIKRLASDTKKMTALEDVSPLPKRHDEIGNLAYDVHSMYNKLKDEIMRVREMEETQRYFFSAASHELKTPIAATSVLLEGMIENIGDYKDHSKYLRECMKLMDSQNKTISEILELVNLNDSKIIPNSEEVNLHKVVTAILPSYQTLADANRQQITLNISEEHFCLTDKAMLKKVLSNIILNAVQNTPSDGEIRIWSEGVADQYRLCVLNTGVFIDENNLSKLFDPFYRVDKARTRKDGRSGLGLTIVRKTLEAMGADFELRQAKDGVLFWFDLPSV
ncbi:MAG: HAMP domain-containing histidine kinase [Defluviitaleaceae bacterium]|nr:HAMP domain-containing histidine kinase [Defluviitaleaceae bacterium]